MAGVRVCFPFKGKTLMGTITYVGKSASVMVEDRHGNYRDSHGKRYAKYHVPLELLEKR